MTGSRARPAIASDDWMHEQQLRAELEAEAWRRLRQDLGVPAPPPQIYLYPATAEPQRQGFDHHKAGSAILKGLVRFAMAAFAAYLAWLAAVDSQIGAFEIWLCVGSAFVVTLALSMFGFARELVHTLAEAARWALLMAMGLGGLWLLAGQIA